MNFGKTLFAQLMEFVPWMSFARIVVRHGGDSGVRNLSCTEQFRAMVFAQLTYRKSLRDIEACLLTNANEARSWHICGDLAMLLIRRARKLYCNDSFGVDLTNTVYALDVGCDDYRPVPVAASMGAVSHQQNGDQTAYPAGFARQYFRVIHITNGKTHEVLILSVSIFEKNQLQQALQGAACIPEQCSADNQLNYSTFNWILLTRALQSAGF